MSNPAPKPTHVAIKVGGSDLDEKYMDRLIATEVDSSLNLPSMAILRFFDDDVDITDNGPFTVGKALEIELPDFTTGNLTRVFIGEVTSLDVEFSENFSAILTVRGYDRSHRLTRGLNTRAFINVTDSDVVQQLAGNGGLTAQVEATTTVHEHLFQHNQTDLAFIHERARRIGYEVVVDDRTLYFRKPRGDRGQVTLTWGQNLRSFHPRISLVGQVNEAIVKGWNVQTKQEIVGRAASTTSHPVTGFGGSGGEKAQSAFANAAKHITVNHPVTTQAEADKVAQAILDEANTGFLRAEGMAFGTAALLAGKKVKIEKVGTTFSGTYLVTSAIHRYAPQAGYDTTFIVEGTRPELMSDLIGATPKPENAARTWHGVVPAVVTNNNDPKGWNRVKVKYPWLDTALESNWARVVAIGAGNAIGIHWLPEVNDEVLVAFEHGDFNFPYVVGGLWNGRDATPETIGNAVGGGKVKRRTIKTRLGHTIRFVDDDSGDQYIEIVDSGAKNKIKLDAKNNKLDITCQGQVALTAQNKIEITTQNNVTLTATGNINIKATGNASLEATGNLTLRGAMVNIN